VFLKRLQFRINKGLEAYLVTIEITKEVEVVNFIARGVKKEIPTTLEIKEEVEKIPTTLEIKKGSKKA
jgi:hypothetical protein